MTNNTPSRRGSEQDAANDEERKHGSPKLRPLMDAKDLNLLASLGALPTTAATTRTRPRTRGVRGGRRSHAKGWLAEAKGEPKDQVVELATVQCVFKETKRSTDEGQEPARGTVTPLPLHRRPGLAVSVPESKGGESKVDGARGATESKLPPSPKSTMPPLPANGPTNGPADQTTLKSASEPFAPTPVQSPTPVRSPMPVRAVRFGTSELTPEPFLKSTPLKATSTGWQPSSSASTASAASAASTAGCQPSSSPLLCDAMPVVAVSYARTPSPPLATKTSLSPPFLSIYAPQAPHHVPLAPLAPLAMLQQQQQQLSTTPTPLTPLAPLASQASPAKVKLAAMDEFMFERVYEISCSGQQIKFCYTAKNILVNGSAGRFL